MKICLVGNPNCGKTTLFNRLTGSRQKVGNWAGVTVEKKTGTLIINDQSHEVIDLPGIYSLDQIDPSQDEAIAASYLQQKDYDLIINIVDTANLTRNLVLTAQLLELNTPVIILANMIDVAKQKGLSINVEALAKRLGTPVIPFIGSSGDGLPILLNTITASAEAITDRTDAITTVSDTCAFGAEEDHLITRTQERFHAIKSMTTDAVSVDNNANDLTEQIDKIVLNRFLGVPIFLFMMYLMFTVAINLGSVFIDFFDILFGALFVDGSTLLLSQIGSPQWLTVIISSGIGAGIQLVATFVPVIGFLYLCLSLLEDSGYLSRAAFVIDRLMSKIGLPGNAFVPLIVGFGCNVPAVMAARTMNRESDRLLTIIMAPFMSCGARLTVYVLFAAAFFPENGENIVFGLYLLGILVAVFTGWLFKKQIFNTIAAPSFIEMPAYHLPVWRNIFFTTWHRLKGFLLRAGKTIVIVVTALSFVNSIGTDGSFGNENSENSVLSVVGKTLTPVFSPLGIEEENWPATVGIFTGMFAKEAIVGTLDALYVESETTEEEFNLSEAFNQSIFSIKDNFVGMLDAWTDPLGLSAASEASQSHGVHEQTLTNMTALFAGQWGAFCYLVLILLYTPCVAVLGAINREAGVAWMWVVVGWTSLLSYGMATVLYQLGTIGQHPFRAIFWIGAIGLSIVLFIQFLKKTGKGIPKNLIPTVSIE